MRTKMALRDIYSFGFVMVLVDLFLWLAAHHVVIVDEVHIGAIDIAVGRVTAQHGDVRDMWEFGPYPVDHIFIIDGVDTRPVTMSSIAPYKVDS